MSDVHFLDAALYSWLLMSTGFGGGARAAGRAGVSGPGGGAFAETVSCAFFFVEIFVEADRVLFLTTTASAGVWTEAPAFFLGVFADGTAGLLVLSAFLGTLTSSPEGFVARGFATVVAFRTSDGDRLARAVEALVTKR